MVVTSIKTEWPTGKWRDLGSEAPESKEKRSVTKTKTYKNEDLRPKTQA